MKWVSFLPYYSNLKAGGLLACAYLASVMSLVLVFAAARAVKAKFKFEQAAAFCLIASGLLWLLPVYGHIPRNYSNAFLLGALILFMPLIKIIYRLPLPHVLVVWSAFAFVQFVLYIYLINHF